MKAKELLDIIVPHGCLLAEDKNSGLRIIVQRPDGMPIARCYTPASAVIAAHALNVLPEVVEALENSTCYCAGMRPKLCFRCAALAKASTVEVPE